jgi:hypothetical protein
MNLQVCRFSIAFIWLYQGIVPKLLGPHADELRMNMALGLNEAQARPCSGCSLSLFLWCLRLPYLHLIQPRLTSRSVHWRSLRLPSCV